VVPLQVSPSRCSRDSNFLSNHASHMMNPQRRRHSVPRLNHPALTMNTLPSGSWPRNIFASAGAHAGGQIDFTADCFSSFARVFDTLDKKIQTDGAFDAPPPAAEV
jgi:hypothetical protein